MGTLRVINGLCSLVVMVEVATLAGSYGRVVPDKLLMELTGSGVEAQMVVTQWV